MNSMASTSYSTYSPHSPSSLNDGGININQSVQSVYSIPYNGSHDSTMHVEGMYNVLFVNYLIL